MRCITADRDTRLCTLIAVSPRLSYSAQRHAQSGTFNIQSHAVAPPTSAAPACAPAPGPGRYAPLPVSPIPAWIPVVL